MSDAVGSSLGGDGVAIEPSGALHQLFLSQSSSLEDEGRDVEDERRNEDAGTPREDEISAKLRTPMHLFSALYAISKVRGRKYVQRLMPHEVADVEPVLATLRWFGWMECRQRCGGTDATDATTGAVPNAIREFKRTQRKENGEANIWESVYSLLTWLGIVSLVPFNLNTIDSSLEQSHLLSRPDLEHSQLERFVRWSARTLHRFRTGRVWDEDVSGENGRNNGATGSSSSLLPTPVEPSVFLVMGVLQTLVAVFKTGHRSNRGIFDSVIAWRNSREDWPS